MSFPTGAIVLLTLCRVTAVMKSVWASMGTCGQSVMVSPDSCMRARDKTTLSEFEPLAVVEDTV